MTVRCSRQALTTRTIYNLPGLKLWIFGPGVEIFSWGII